MYIISNFAKWKHLNEGLFWDVVEKEPVNGTTHKVKVKYLDGNSFKVKAVNDRDMVGADGSIDPTLMDGIVAFLKGHDVTDFARQYPALQDLATFYKDSFFTYNVKKETDNKQVIVFSIQKRASFKGVTPETKILSDDAAAKLAQAPDAKAVLANSDKSLLNSTAEKPAAAAAPVAGSVKLDSPVLIADLSKLTAEMPMFKAIDGLVAGLATSKMFTDKKALELINKSADELEASKIGDSTVSLINGIIAGLGLGTFTDKYGRAKPRTQITQEVADKILALAPAPSAEVTAQNSSRNRKVTGKRINEQAADKPAAPAAPVTATPALPANFKMEEFLKAIGGGEVTTGDIKLPEGGIQKATAAKGDAVLKLVQQLIIDKLGAVLADDATFTKFKGYGADGNYGPTTEKVITMAKAGFELKDQDGAVITPELVNKLQTDKITESYLGLRGQLVETFNVGAAKAASSGKASTGNTGSVDKKSDEVKSDDSKSVSDEVIKMLRDASQVMSDYYKNKGNFTEYKGGINDDEDKAVSEIFGSGVEDTSSWWYRNIWNKYVIQAKAKIDTIKDTVVSAALTKEYNKFASLYTNLKTKTVGGTDDDEYIWSIADLAGNKVTYTVDCDF